MFISTRLITLIKVIYILTYLLSEQKLKYISHDSEKKSVNSVEFINWRLVISLITKLLKSNKVRSSFKFVVVAIKIYKSIDIYLYMLVCVYWMLCVIFESDYKMLSYNCFSIALLNKFFSSFFKFYYNWNCRASINANKNNSNKLKCN